MKIDIKSENPVIQRVIDVLNENKFSQTALAKLLGITPQGVGQLLRGMNTPETKHLIKISERFGLDLNQLLKLDKTQPTLWDLHNSFANNSIDQSHGSFIGNSTNSAPTSSNQVQALGMEIESLKKELAHKDQIISNLESQIRRQDEFIEFLKGKAK